MMVLRGIAVGCVALMLGTVALQAREAVAALSTELQVAMQRHIDTTLIEGAILHLDTDTGALHRLYPTKAHPLVIKGDGFFVLCATLFDVDGRAFEVDYYFALDGDTYRVFRSEVDNRAVLRDMMQAGLAHRF